MKHLRLDNFIAGPDNQQALDLCRRLAAEEPAGASPIVFFGPPGAGKSHLLWGIVNAIRASESRTGLVLVLPHEFPQKVKDLIQDPSPIRDGRRAILLVDDLHRFEEEEAGSLEQVVSVFLDQGHPVALASAFHLDRLDQYTPWFKGLLDSGQVLEVGPAPLPTQADAEAASAQIEAQQEEIASLQRQLDQVRSDHGGTDMEELRQLYEAARLERDDLEQKLAEKAAAAGEAAELRGRLAEARAEAAEARAAKARVEEDLDAAQRALRAQKAEATEAVLEKLRGVEEELAQTREERDALEVQLAERAGVSAETTRLRDELHQAEQMIETTQAAQAALDAELAQATAHADALAQEKAGLAGEVEELQRRNEESELARQRAQSSLAALQSRYEPLAQRLHEAEVEAEEALAAQVRLQGQVAQKKRLEEELAALADHIEAEADSRAAARQRFLDELEALLGQVAAQAQAGRASEALEEEIATLQSQRERLELDLGSARDELRKRQLALETARRTLALQAAEMDALRDAAASQVATASVQAGELEFYVGQLESALEISRKTGQELASELQQIAGRFNAATEGLDAAAQRVAFLTDLKAEGAPPPRRDEAQATFFDTELFRYLPEDEPVVEGQEA